MKKSKNCTWLILGILTILLGIFVPLFAFNNPITYEYNKDTQASQVTFYVVVTSENEIKDIQNEIVNISYKDGDTEEYETYFIRQSKVDDKFKYEFKIVETDDWEEAERIKSVKLRTIDGVIEIDKKVDWSTKIPVMVFCCVIGVFMIFVNFFNNSSKNRKMELKEIIAATGYNGFNTFEEIQNAENQSNEEDIIKEVQKEIEEVQEEKVPETKECAYCGTLADINDKVCASCGAKFKKN